MHFRIVILLVSIFLFLFKSAGTEYRVDRGKVIRSLLLDGKLKPLEYTPVKAAFEGNLVEISEDGSRVKKGDQIAILDTYEIEKRHRRKQLEYFVKRVEVAKKKLETENEAIDDSVGLTDKEKEMVIQEQNLKQKKFARDAREVRRQQLTIKKTEQMIEFYKTHLTELEKLSGQGALSTTELDEERIKYKEYQIRGQQLKLDYEKLRDGNLLEIRKAKKNFEKAQLKFEHEKQQAGDRENLRKLNLAVAEDELKEKFQELEEEESALKNSVLTAPFDGVVSLQEHWVGAGMEVYKPGHHIWEGNIILDMTPGGRVKGNFAVHELDLGSIRPGQEVLFQVIPLGEKWRKGKITSIGVNLTDVSRWNKDFYNLKKVDVEMEVLDTDPGMKPKMSIIGRVILKKKSGVLRVPHHCFYQQKLFTVQNEPIQVQVGIQGDDFVEILSGVTEGQSLKCKARAISQNPGLNQNTKAHESEFFESVVGSGELRTRNEVLISPSFRSTLKKLLASGKEVKKGEIIALQDTKKLETELQSKEIALTQKEVELKTAILEAKQKIVALRNEIELQESILKVESKQLSILSTGDPENVIAKVMLEQEKAILESKFQDLNFQIQESLKTKGYIKSTEYQKSLESLKDAKIEKQIKDLELDLKTSPASRIEYKKQKKIVESLQANIQRKKKKLLNIEEIMEFDQKLSNLQVDLARFEVEAIKNEITRAEVLSPKEGIFIVNNHWSQGKIIPYKTGDEVGPGDVVGRVVEFKDFYIQGKLDESTFYRLKSGQTVYFYLSGRKDKNYPGTLTSIAPIPRKARFWDNSTPTIEVQIDTKANSRSFQPGTSVQYEVRLSKPRKGISIPKGALYEGPDGHFVYRNAKGNRHPVKPGFERLDQIEILEGLKLQDSVYWEEPQ